MRQKPEKPRLDWRDPSMPVLRDYKMRDGTTKTIVDPDYEQGYREHLMQTTSPINFPSWKDDPTYFGRKR